MEDFPGTPEQKRSLPERNPVTYAAHRRSFAWQVLLPFLLFVLIFLAMTVGVSLAAVGGSSQLRRWADVAIIWQLPLPIFLSLLCLIMNIGLLYGVIQLIGVIPGAARLLHNYIVLVQTKVTEISDKSVAPILKTSSNQAKIQQLRKILSRK